ncbi:MAG: phosphatase PAP2 family protein [Bryobacteraceae bacterium]
MDRPNRRHAVLAAAALCLFLLLAAAVVAGRTLHFDLALRSEIHNLSVSPVTSAMLIVTSFGSYLWIVPAGLVAFLLLRRQGKLKEAVLLAVVLTGAIPIEYGLKQLVHRPRPDAYFNVPQPTSYSFPSGHALFSTSFYGTLGYFSAQLASRRLQRGLIWLAAGASIAAICLSRVYLGVHYPTDVAGGVLIACAWINAVLTFAKSR